MREFEECAEIAVDPTISLQELLTLVIQHDVPHMLDSLYQDAMKFGPRLYMPGVVDRAMAAGSVGVAVRATCYHAAPMLGKVLQMFGAAAQEPLRDSIDRQEVIPSVKFIQAYFNAYSDSFDDVFRWVGKDRISLQELKSACPNFSYEQAWAAMKRGKLPAKALLPIMSQDELIEHANAWVAQGVVRAIEVAPRLDGRAAGVSDLFFGWFLAGQLDFKTWQYSMPSKPFTDAQLATLHAKGRITLSDRIIHSPDPMPLLVDPALPQDTFLACAVATYTTQRQLLPREVALAAMQPSLTDLIAAIPWHANTDRPSYVLRMAAAHAQGVGAYIPVPGAAPLADCLVCYGACHHEHAAMKPAACTHAPSMGASCLLLAVQSRKVDTCPHPGCKTPLTPNDLLAMGAPASDADALAHRIVTRHRALPPLWRPCPTPLCIGGAVVEKDRLDYKCGVCNARSSLTRQIDAATLDLSDRMRIRALLHDMRGWGNREGKTRECFHCGVPATHAGGCPAMYCTRCNGDYYFDTGTSLKVALSEAQHYVPKDSLMVRAGIYRGLKPGKAYLSASYVRARAYWNAWRLGIWRDEAGHP